MHFLAERAGFEPAVGCYPTHAFQACDLSRSSTSPEGRHCNRSFNGVNVLFQKITAITWNYRAFCRAHLRANIEPSLDIHSPQRRGGFRVLDKYPETPSIPFPPQDLTELPVIMTGFQGSITAQEYDQSQFASEAGKLRKLAGFFRY